MIETPGNAPPCASASRAANLARSLLCEHAHGAHQQADDQAATHTYFHDDVSSRARPPRDCGDLDLPRGRQPQSSHNSSHLSRTTPETRMTRFRILNPHGSSGQKHAELQLMLASTSSTTYR